VRQAGGEADDHQREEDPIERTLAEFMKVASIPAPAPRCEAAGCS
jgi:hypothetical protein